MALTALQGASDSGELGASPSVDAHSTALPYWSSIEAKADPNPTGGLVDMAAHTKQAMDALVMGGGAQAGAPRMPAMRAPTDEYGMPIEDDPQMMSSLGLV